MICLDARVPVILTAPLPEGTVLTVKDGNFGMFLTVREMNAILDWTSGSLNIQTWNGLFSLNARDIEFRARKETLPIEYVKVEFDTEAFRSVVKQRLEFVKSVLQSPEETLPKTFIDFFLASFSDSVPQSLSIHHKDFDISFRDDEKDEGFNFCVNGCSFHMDRHEIFDLLDNLLN